MCSSVARSFLPLSVALQLQLGGTSSAQPKCAVNVNYRLCGCQMMGANLKDGANSVSLCSLATLDADLKSRSEMVCCPYRTHKLVGIHLSIDSVCCEWCDRGSGAYRSRCTRAKATLPPPFTASKEGWLYFYPLCRCGGGWGMKAHPESSFPVIPRVRLKGNLI